MDTYPANSAHASDQSSNTLTEIPTHHSIQPKPASHWQIVKSHSLLVPDVVNYAYSGRGAQEDPYVVEYLPDDPRDPMGFTFLKKWILTFLVAFATLTVSFVSSAYSGGFDQIIDEFKVSDEVVVLGIALFVLGFVIGPLFWAPLSEMYGRQLLFFISFAGFTAFNAAGAGAQNIETLIITRFFAGVFGSSPLTNAGGVIADMFSAAHRGLALAIFAAAPFMGPTLGPIVGGFLAQAEGWRWLQGLMAIFSGVLWILCTLTVPETYGPVILRSRAKALSKRTGKVYKSRADISQGEVSLANAFKVALSRPWILLFREPIVFLFSVYMSIVYGTLYMMIPAFPIVFQQERGWSQGIGGLSFIGVAIGMIAAVIYTIFDNTRYRKAEDGAVAKGERGAPPEARLPPAMIGCVCIPVGLFIFAWTNYPSIHWIVCILFTTTFGFGFVLVFLSTFNYLIDTYTIYAASVLAASSILRSTFGAAFPLFTTSMYRNLGIHWASSIPPFLALACVPFPFLFYKYGPPIRKKCKYSREAEEFMDQIMARKAQEAGEGEGRRSQSQHEGTGNAMSSRSSVDKFSSREAEQHTEKSRASAPPEMAATVGPVTSSKINDGERDTEKGEAMKVCGQC